VIRETMTAQERIMAAIRLEPYDRVPVAPHINGEFPLRLRGRPLTDFYRMDKVAQNTQFMKELFDEVGGWDAFTMTQGGMPLSDEAIAQFAAFYGDTMRFPGGDDRISAEESPPQFAEREILTPDDYDDIIRKGWHHWLLENMETRISRSIFGIPFSVMSLPTVAALATAGYVASRETWLGRCVPMLAGANPCDPQMCLSLLRGLLGFTVDLYQHSEKVKEVLRVINRDMIQGAIDSMLRAGRPNATGLPGIIVACERGSGQYYNLEIFEQFIWPFIREQVEAWTAAGFVVTMHCDTDWTRNLPYFTQLPKGKVILMLDSTTDIFKAKEILGGHLCIMGDVPPALSTHGTVDEMREYCEKLIDVVGRDGGFILSTGCAVPPGTKIENFKMMINTAKTYAHPRTI
jgi:hypothetical protein